MKKIKDFINQVMKHNLFMLASSLAYTTAIALGPFLIVLFSMASYLTDDAQNKITNQFKLLFGAQVGGAIQSIMAKASDHPDWRGVAGILGLTILLVSASAIFSQLRTELDQIDEQEPKESDSGIKAFLRSKLFSIGLVLGFAFLLITSLVLTSVFSMTMSPEWTQLITMPAHFLFFAVAFTMIFRYCPSETLAWKRASIAGVTASVFFMVGRTLIGVYLEKAAIDSVYGAAGSVIIFLIWSYYSSLTLLLSYEFSRHVLFEGGTSRSADLRA